jgi:hypothetical protein
MTDCSTVRRHVADHAISPLLGNATTINHVVPICTAHVQHRRGLKLVTRSDSKQNAVERNNETLLTNYDAMH